MCKPSIPIFIFIWNSITLILCLLIIPRLFRPKENTICEGRWDLFIIWFTNIIFIVFWTAFKSISWCKYFKMAFLKRMLNLSLIWKDVNAHLIMVNNWIIYVCFDCVNHWFFWRTSFFNETIFETEVFNSGIKITHPYHYIPKLTDHLIWRSAF